MIISTSVRMQRGREGWELKEIKGVFQSRTIMEQSHGAWDTKSSFPQNLRGDITELSSLSWAQVPSQAILEPTQVASEVQVLPWGTCWPEELTVNKSCGQNLAQSRQDLWTENGFWQDLWTLLFIQWENKRKAWNKLSKADESGLHIFIQKTKIYICMNIENTGAQVLHWPHKSATKHQHLGYTCLQTNT